MIRINLAPTKKKKRGGGGKRPTVSLSGGEGQLQFLAMFVGWLAVGTAVVPLSSCRWLGISAVLKLTVSLPDFCPQG